MTDGQDESRQVLAHAQMKETYADHVRKLEPLCSSFKTRTSKMLQECDERMVEQEQLRTERVEKSSQYLDASSSARHLSIDGTSGEGR